MAPKEFKKKKNPTTLSLSRFLLLKAIIVYSFECISNEFICVLTVKSTALYMLNTFTPKLYPHPNPVRISCILSLGCF